MNNQRGNKDFLIIRSREKRRGVTAAVGRADAGVDQAVGGQAGGVDGDHRRGQRLTGLTAAQPLVVLKAKTNGKFLLCAGASVWM